MLQYRRLCIQGLCGLRMSISPLAVNILSLGAKLSRFTTIWFLNTMGLVGPFQTSIVGRRLYLFTVCIVQSCD